MSNDTIQSLSTEIADGLRAIARHHRDRADQILARHQLQQQHREERWQSLMGETEAILQRYQ